MQAVTGRKEKPPRYYREGFLDFNPKRKCLAPRLSAEARAAIRQGRSDPRSSPWSTPPRSHCTNFSLSPRMHRLPRGRAAASASRRSRSTRVPVHFSSPRLRGRAPRTRLRRPSRLPRVPMSSRLTKKSLVSVSGRLVKTPCWDCRQLASSTRRPPTRTVISGAVSVNSCARSTSSFLRPITAYLPLR